MIDLHKGGTIPSRRHQNASSLGLKLSSLKKDHDRRTGEIIVPRCKTWLRYATSLYLNVWVPRTAFNSSILPVKVWRDIGRIRNLRRHSKCLVRRLQPCSGWRKCGVDQSNTRTVRVSAVRQCGYRSESYCDVRRSALKVTVGIYQTMRLLSVRNYA